MTSPGRRPTAVHELARAQDRLSFLYLDRCIVNRDSNAVTATDERGTVHVPAAAVGALLLGPGTTVTHQAIALMAESGSTVVWVGERGVRYYAHGQGLARSSRLLEAQAEAVTNRRARLRVARDMYALRFPEEDVTHLTMQQLRGREGARVRRLYQEQSRRTGVAWTKRVYDVDDWEGGDPVNRALSAAHSSLYGVVHAVIVALGCSPALGFVHTGHSRAFVYDIADLYKAESTIPVAFDVVADGIDDIAGATRRRLRDSVFSSHLLSRCTHDIRRLLLGETEVDDEGLQGDVISLWDEHQEAVAGGVSYDVPW